MALQIIDRRLAGKNKSVGNRERFVRRFKEQIADSVRRAVSQRGIREIEQAENITIPRKDISEPVFHHGQGGIRDMVHPGNAEHVRGDRIERPQGGGGRGSQASDSGEGEDDFTFTLTKEEFMQLFFEDLALPHLLRTHIGENPQWKSRRAGYSQDGIPNNLAVLRTMRGALGRRIALGKSAHREQLALQQELDALLAQDDGTSEAVAELQHRIDLLKERVGRIPYLDPIDLRFRARVQVPVPSSQQGGDVLPDGRFRLHGRGAQGPGQALLHPALPVSHAALRDHRHRVHPPPHAGGRGERGAVLSLHRKRRYGGQQRTGAARPDHPRALPHRRLEHLRGAGERR
jgi:uncharacterized sporulation protein YeaH/YhbH (DUF444 family)